MDPEIDAEYKAHPEKWIHILEIKTLDGDLYRKRIEYPIGDQYNPFDWKMTDEKFFNVTREYLPAKEIRRLIERIHNLEDLEDINSLFEQ